MTDRQYKRFRYLYSQGLTDKEIALDMHVAHCTVQSWRKKYGLRSNVPAHSNRERSRTLCWDCRNAVFGCSWRKHFIPVEGWDATPHMLYVRDKAHGGVQSYEVHRCPQYVPDGRADG